MLALVLLAISGCGHYIPDHDKALATFVPMSELFGE
jgi:predicted small lipoprotein YifL